MKQCERDRQPGSNTIAMTFGRRQTALESAIPSARGTFAKGRVPTNPGPLNRYLLDRDNNCPVRQERDPEFISFTHDLHLLAAKLDMNFEGTQKSLLAASDPP